MPIFKPTKAISLSNLHTIKHRLPFADLGVDQDLREVKNHLDYAEKREEILSMIWDMEEEIMGRMEAQS